MNQVQVVKGIFTDNSIQVWSMDVIVVMGDKDRYRQDDIAQDPSEVVKAICSD